MTNYDKAKKFRKEVRHILYLIETLWSNQEDFLDEVEENDIFNYVDKLSTALDVSQKALIKALNETYDF